MTTIDSALNPALGQTRFGDRPLGSYRQRWLSACVIGLCTLLASCGDSNKKISVEVSGYNHIPAGSWSISAFRIFGGGGPNMRAGEGGGGFNCCVKIPVRWYPGLKAKVEWYYDGREDGPEPPPPQEATIDVPDYGDKPGTVNVHFYPNHRVLVVVGPYGIEHPKYKISEADKFPWQTRKDLIEP